MILDADIVLKRWAYWANKVESRALGISSVHPMFRGLRPETSPERKIPINLTAMETDTAINRLSLEDREMAVQGYKLGGLTKNIVKRMGISHRTYYRRMDNLHRNLLTELRRLY